MEEASGSEKKNRLKIEEIIFYNNIEYQLTIQSSNNNNIIIKVETINIEDLDEFYEIKYSLKDLYSLNKFFRLFDTIEEVFKGLENNKNIVKEKKNDLQIYDINYEDSIMVVKMNLYLMTGETQLLEIKLKTVKYTDKDVIAKLNLYIDYLKNIPGVNDLITSYEKYKYKIKDIFITEKTKIIPKYEDFEFIYKELCAKLNKTDIKLFQKFNALKDGDTAEGFHQKCDNIGPNLILIKTKENVVLGGFTMNNWSCQTKNKKDDSSFLFNVRNRKIYNIKKGENSTCCTNETSIYFFNGTSSYPTLCVPNNFFTTQSNTCEKADTSFKDFSTDYELNNGNQYFFVAEMEIYEINY
jgi:hypothetical protein